ncbi:MarR family winged helix-turn-helix transcriptional regulator [Methylosarcina fibrata]|uniref:MarR family winged helix-turn-helix transcriptional regulator n=1 Tax=Methylosarcina fibrata TaxID=105972 RepID=UPI000375F61A|nr:MarR family transcriptional regulator [Methylosarcina fibrata]
MEKLEIFELIERMAALIRSEERKKCTELGLQPVHFQVLDYLSRCNRYSDTPAALANYLGMTRGTVSQTLLLLEKKGFLEKKSDSNDRRMVHLHLLPEGAAILTKARSTELFKRATLLLKNYHIDQNEIIFANALLALQKAHQSQSFGLCKSCRHFTPTGSGFVCDLTKEPLSQNDSEKICQEHSVA